MHTKKVWLTLYSILLFLSNYIKLSHVLCGKTQTYLVHIVLNIDPIVTKPAPVENPVAGLSIGAGLAKIGTMRSYL